MTHESGTRFPILVVAAIVGMVVCLIPASTFAVPGISIDASALQFVYQPGAGGPGSVGRIDITPTSSSSLVVQEYDLGADGDFGGGNDTVVDLAAITGRHFDVTFTADVFYLGSANSYAIVGTYVVEDFLANTVVEGDFMSSYVILSNDTLFVGGDLTNPDGILRPGSPATSWTFAGDPGSTPDIVNGVFGGADGIDGVVTLPDFRDDSTSASLFNFEFIAGFPDLDAFFNDGIQASTLSDIQVTVVVPAPGGSVLGMIGLATVGWLRRRLSRS